MLINKVKDSDYNADDFDNKVSQLAFLARNNVIDLSEMGVDTDTHSDDSNELKYVVLYDGVDYYNNNDYIVDYDVNETDGSAILYTYNDAVERTGDICNCGGGSAYIVDISKL